MNTVKLKPSVRTGNTRPGYRKFNKKLLVGYENEFIGEKLDILTGKPMPHTFWILSPRYQKPLSRSKYMPHQGIKECARRAAR